MRSVEKELGLLLLLAAPCSEACRHMPEPALVCGYIQEPSADNPYAELSPQGDCGERTEDGLILAPEHLAALSFGPEGLGWVYTRDGVFYVKPSAKP